MELKTVDRQPVRVACLRYTGPFGPAIGEFWRDNVQPWLQANELNVSTYGLALDDAASTPAEKLRYDACAEVKPGFVGTGLYHLAIIPGGKYAVAAFKGTAAEIGAAWGEVMSQAMPASASMRAVYCCGVSGTTPPARAYAGGGSCVSTGTQSSHAKAPVSASALKSFA